MKYQMHDDVAVLTFDDGKANAVGHDFVDGMNEGLDKASAEAKAIVIHGMAGKFSAGFDLKEFQKGPEEAKALRDKGFAMLLRLFSHPQPVVAACTGHAMAAGALILLSCDTRIGIHGDFKIGLNESAIGMGLPIVGFELAESRLSKRHLTAAVAQARLYDPTEAVDAGYLDQVVDPEDVTQTAIEHASGLAQIPGDAYAMNKTGSRRLAIERIQASLQA